MIPASFPYIDEEIAGRLLCKAAKAVKEYKEEREIRLRTKLHEELSDSMRQRMQKAVLDRLETVQLAPDLQSAEKERLEGLGRAMDWQREAAQQLFSLLP